MLWRSLSSLMLCCIVLAQPRADTISDKIRLVGTITGTTPMALVVVDQRKHLLTIGDSIAHMQLRSIEKRRVLFVQGNQQHWLWLESRQPDESVTPDNITRTTLSASLLNDIGNHPQKWLHAVELTPVIEEGWIAGYRIVRIRAPELVQNLNIREQDVISAINGVPVRQAAEFAQLVNDLNKANELTLELLREGYAVQIHFFITH